MWLLIVLENVLLCGIQKVLLTLKPATYCFRLEQHYQDGLFCSLFSHIPTSVEFTDWTCISKTACIIEDCDVMFIATSIRKVMLTKKWDINDCKNVSKKFTQSEELVELVSIDT